MRRFELTRLRERGGEVVARARGAGPPLDGASERLDRRSHRARSLMCETPQIVRVRVFRIVRSGASHAANSLA